MKNSKGFTLIELLVVIAIIGILSSVVLASLTTARSRGTAAAVQSELANMRAQAELYYSTTGNNGYSTTAAVSCTTSPSVFVGVNSLSSLLAGLAAKSVTPTCVASSTAWGVSATVNGMNYCVDSTGKSIATTTATTVSLTALCV